MAKQKKPLTAYQKGVIKRYYDNRESLAHQNISELVSDLYLEKNGKKLDTLWGRVRAALANTGASKEEAHKIVSDRDIQALAKYAIESS